MPERKTESPEAEGPGRQPPGLADETDADLLVYMAAGDEGSALAREAWGEFYRRHSPYLYAVCLRAYGPLFGGDAGASDLVAETFRRAYEKAGTFDAQGITDPQRLQLRVRAWLGRIAQRLAHSALRGQGKLRAAMTELAQWQELARERPSGPAVDPAAVAAVRSALESLSDKEQLVIRVTMQWYRPGDDHQRLPDDVCGELAETLGTTGENLRQIRRRAMRKIEALLKQKPDGVERSPS